MSTNNLLSQTVSITQPLLKSFRSAYGRYKWDLEDKKKNKKKNKELQQLENELEAVNTQCNYLQETILSHNFKFIEYAKKAEEKNQMVF